MSWRQERKKKEEKKMPFIVATYVYACSPRAAQTLRLDQFDELHFLSFLYYY
jgi:hypothetical protein